MSPELTFAEKAASSARIAWSAHQMDGLEAMKVLNMLRFAEQNPENGQAAQGMAHDRLVGWIDRRKACNGGADLGLYDLNEVIQSARHLRDKARNGEGQGAEPVGGRRC